MKVYFEDIPALSSESARQWDAVKANPDLLGDPPAITDEVRMACKTLSAHEPRRVQCIPFDGAVPRRCYANVAAMTDVMGGSCCVGFSLWQCEKPFLAGDLHAVWQPAGNHETLVCVTPQAKNDSEIVFLPLEFDVVMNGDWEPKHEVFCFLPLAAKAKPFCDAERNRCRAEIAGDDCRRRYWQDKAERLWAKL